MEREQFEQLVAEAIERLPQEFLERLENIEVVVQDWPTPEQLVSAGLRHRTELLGLYEGIPLTQRGDRMNLVLPDKITIFQKPMEMAYRSDRGIIRGIGDTVRHEIAHYFGINDTRLSEIERQRRKRIKKSK